ncbi:MAG: transglycosylase SLT domain-containing protein [bacterium]
MQRSTRTFPQSYRALRVSVFTVFMVILASWWIGVRPLPAQDAHIEAARQGMVFLAEGKFGDAEKTFTRLIAENFLLKDFALLWRARAYEQMEDYEHALADIAAVGEKYPDSPALQDTLKLAIAISREQNMNGRGTTAAYEAYRAHYPDDRSIQYEYAQFLKGQGIDEEAARILRRLYIDGAEFSEEASRQVDTAGLDVKDLVQRGENLLGQWKFADAEATFKQALPAAPEELKDEIGEKIALSEFRQKKYITSAEKYGLLNDRYLEAVSYLRTGDMKRFTENIEALKAMQDPRRGALLIALAAEKRRGGASGEALAILREARTVSPFQEQALWETGWTYYLSGDYASSLETFSALYDRYQSKKYLYWMLRSTGKMSADPIDKYRDLCLSERDYYGFLGCVRSGEKMKKILDTGDGQKTDMPQLDRYRMLKALGLQEEAVRELTRRARAFAGTDQMILYGRELREVGEYRGAITVAARLPYSDETHGLLYPLAYWDIVQEASRRFRVNPLYVLSIAREESRLDPGARSPAGAVGLMQLMPETAGRLSGKIKLPVPKKDQFFDVQTNIMLGAYYLEALLDHYQSFALATAAYNAGEHVVQNWIEQVHYSEADEFIEDIPYQETRNYVKKVLTTFSQYLRASPEGDAEYDLISTIGISFSQNRRQ